MPAPQHLTDFISLQRQLSLNDLLMDDMFDIESDAVKVKLFFFRPEPSFELTIFSL